MAHKTVVWIHKKSGDRYTVLTVALDSETLQDKVVYLSLDTGFTWVRDAEEFFDGRFEVTEVELKVR